MSTEDSSDVTDDISFPRANIEGVQGIAGILATSLGPMSHDKFIGKSIALQNDPDGVAYDDYVVTSDGGTILDALPMEHPIAPVVKRIVGDELPGETGVEGGRISDGIISTVLLCGSLLDEAESLMEHGLHPTTIAGGFRAALTVAESSLRSARRPVSSFDDEHGAVLTVAQTAMTGNNVGGNADQWASFAVDAAEAVGYPTPKSLGVEAVSGGSISDSRLVYGTVLPRNEIAHEDMPIAVDDARVLVLSGYKRKDASDGRVGGLRNPELQADATLDVSSPSDIASYEDVYASRRERVIRDLVNADVDVVVTRLGIDDRYLRALADEGIMGIRGVNRLRLARVALATGANQVRDPTDIATEDIGHAGRVARITLGTRSGSRRLRYGTVFEGCEAPSSVTVLLRGAGAESGSETARQIRKGAAAVALATGKRGSAPGVVPGGGAVDVGVARDVRQAAREHSSREQLAMVAFADAIERIPYGLAKNAGLDPLTTVSNLRAAAADRYETGLLLPSGKIGNTVQKGVLDSFSVRRDGYVTAVDIAETILRVDDAIDANVSQEPADEGDSIYDEHAEKHQDHLDEHGTEGTVWE